MDFDSPLVSPTKARAAARTASDWSIATAFLSRLFHPNPIPSFERNSSTLKAILTLAAENDASDELNWKIAKANEAELRRSQQDDEKDDTGEEDEEGINPLILTALKTSLPPESQTALSDLASLAILLHPITGPTDSKSDLYTPSTTAQSLITLTRLEFDLAQRVHRVTQLQTHLDQQVSTLQSQLDSLQTNPAYTTPPSLPQQTADWTRATKVLTVKVSEYTDRLGGLQERVDATVPGPDGSGGGYSIEDVVKLEKDVRERRERTKALEERVGRFEGLPADIEGARDVYRALVAELERLEGRREDLFGGLIDR